MLDARQKPVQLATSTADSALPAVSELSSQQDLYASASDRDNGL